MSTVIRLESRRKLRPVIEDHLHLWVQSRLFLADEARKAALNAALSYRNFTVGCALYAFKPDAYYYNDVHKVFRGVNMKIGKNSHKICAEQVAIGAARAEGYRFIIGMAVAGKPQPDDESFLAPDTLHSCSDCRELFKKLPELSGDSRIITAHLTEEIYE
ncbi:MAG: cytidine deaminase [bacterium]|nr:cytidine deaminase [bacterium]